MSLAVLPTNDLPEVKRELVDADAVILDHFRFDFVPPKSKRKNTTYCWRARNPINGLEYGFGAVKLFPRKQLMTLGNRMPDFSTNVASIIRYINQRRVTTKLL